MATKERKQNIVTELQEFFNNGKVVIVADLTGLSVAEFTGFRRTLRKENAKLRVAKNTLVKRAIGDTEFKQLETLAKGPSGFIVGYDDPAQPAKVVTDYLKAIKKGSIRGAVLEGKALNSEDVKGLASLPSKEVLLSGIMGALDSGAQGIAGIMSAVIRDIAYLVEEVAKTKGEAAAPKVEAAASTEPPEAPKEEAVASTEESAAPQEAEAPKEESAAPEEDAAPKDEA